MGGGGGWPDSSTKAETGLLRGILKEEEVYLPEFDRVREFDLFRAICGNWNPRQAVEERLQWAKDDISRYFWVECGGYDDHQEPLWYRRIAGYRPMTTSYY